jgi:hypothetical protein
MACQRLEDHVEAYSQAANVQFKNDKEATRSL